MPKAPLQSLLSHPKSSRQTEAPLMQSHPLLLSKSSNSGNSGGGLSNKLLPGDWICPSCHLNNFAARVKCIQCGASHEGALRPVDRVGDWACPNDSCRFHNFANRRECHRCGTRKPLVMGASPQKQGHQQQQIQQQQFYGKANRRGSGGPKDWGSAPREMASPCKNRSFNLDLEFSGARESAMTLVDEMDLPTPISELAPCPPSLSTTSPFRKAPQHDDGEQELPIKSIFRDYGQSFFSSNPFASYGFRNESSS